MAAIRAAQLGMNVACVENEDLGGVCLNVGCIPSKALLDSSEHFHAAEHKFAEHGILTGDLKVDISQMMQRKEKVVNQMTGGIEFLMKKNKIDVHVGLGSFVDAHRVKVSGDEEKTLEADRIIIATGSKPSSLPGMKIFFPSGYEIYPMNLCVVAKINVGQVQLVQSSSRSSSELQFSWTLQYSWPAGLQVCRSAHNFY